MVNSDNGGSQVMDYNDRSWLADLRWFSTDVFGEPPNGKSANSRRGTLSIYGQFSISILLDRRVDWLNEETMINGVYHMSWKNGMNKYVEILSGNQA